MKFSVGLAKQKATETATDAMIEAALNGLQGKTPHLGMLFVTTHHAPQIASSAKRVQQATGVKVLAGCTAEGVIGGDLEVERQPAMCLWLAHLPQVAIHAFHMEYSQQSGEITGWPPDVDNLGKDHNLLLLGDPFTFPTDYFLQHANESYPLMIAGGMASGGLPTTGNCLLLGEKLFYSGALGLILHGNIQVLHVVSQGCAPIGKYFVITKAKKNVIYQLGGRPALNQLQEMIAKFSAKEQNLIQQGLHLGVAINAAQDSFCRGDFLVRNLMGVDHVTGAILVTDMVRPGQTVQFHVRDQTSASEDLQMLLEQKTADQNLAGALLFSCNGRGQRMFATPNHDVQAIHRQLGPIPIAGFFAAGEIGPIGDKNFLHGFTASAVLFGEQ